MIAETAKAFAHFYKAERERSEKALADILDILCRNDKPEDQVGKVMERLERHWGRYGEPGSLTPLADTFADLPET